MSDDIFSSGADENAERQSRVNFNTSSAEDFLTCEAFKTLRTNILFCGSDIKVILVTSCTENEGKSTISAELSKSLCDIDKSTLLIDADMRKSVLLKKNARMRNITGLSELLSGQADISDVIYRTQHNNFSVIFAGAYPPNPVELLAAERFKEVINTLRDRFDYIIIDSPPLNPVIDAAVIAKQCDGSVLVIDRNRISYRVAQSVKSQLEKSGCRILGAVLNETERGSGSYYKKYYNKKYSYYTQKQ